MPGTRNDYGQMYDHALNPRKGWGPSTPGALEKALPIESSQTGIYAGSAVYVNTDNEFVLGVGSESTTQGYPPYFAFQGQNSFDVNPDLGNVAGGVLMALSCLGCFELETTEVKASESFNAGKFLTPHTDGTLKVGTVGTSVICGIVSETGPNTDGTFENEHGQDVLRFHTYYLPSALAAG
jgi:hypothetical protein